LVQILSIVQNKLRDGLEMVPARSHKPNDAGSNPAPATKIFETFFIRYI